MKKPDCDKCQSLIGWSIEFCEDCEKRKKYAAYLENKRKFKRGEPIKTLDELLKQDFVMWYGKTTHISVILNQQLGYVLDGLDADILCYAIRKEENK